VAILIAAFLERGGHRSMHNSRGGSNVARRSTRSRRQPLTWLPRSRPR
jgi:hypothetical protein